MAAQRQGDADIKIEAMTGFLRKTGAKKNEDCVACF
jgi:hypothetical protein